MIRIRISKNCLFIHTMIVEKKLKIKLKNWQKGKTNLSTPTPKLHWAHCH